MNLHPRTMQLLAHAGLEPAELDALAFTLPHGTPQAPRGFGLLGPTGTLKTSTLVHVMAQLVERMVRRQPDPDRATLLWLDGEGVAHDARLRWVYWPKTAEMIRRRRWEKAWIEDWAEMAEEVPFLVLDDIGREQRDANDPAQEVLQRVLDARHRRKRALWWTSNRTREELSTFYGGPFMSRLLGTWPDYDLGGHDRRLFPEDLKAAAGGER